MGQPSKLHYCYHDSPVGSLLIGGTAGRLEFLNFPQSDRPREIKPDWINDPVSFDGIRSELDHYFAGTLTEFQSNYHVMGTDFQRAVWLQLAAIPYGKLQSYGDIAKALGKPGASRAVGLANNANPLPIIIPCHRVIGASGALTGFGGGMETKIWLLEHEGITPSQIHNPDQMGFEF